MSAITQATGGVAGTLAARNRALTTPAGQAAPTIADLVGGVGRNLAMRDAAMVTTNPAAYLVPGSAPSTPAAAAPQVGIGDVMRSLQQAQAAGAGDNSIAGLIRQVRQLQGF